MNNPDDQTGFSAPPPTPQYDPYAQVPANDPYAAVPGNDPYYPVQTVLGKRRSVGMVILLSIVTCGIWTVVWSYQNGEELKRYRGKGIGGALYAVITAFVSVVTMFLLAGEVEEAYRDLGYQSPVNTMTGLWFLLPIAGPIVWYVKMQDAINQYWTMLGQTNEPGL